MADEQGITPEQKIRRALELLLTRGREHKVQKQYFISGRTEKELGILLLILLTYNRETDVIRLEKDIESMLKEKNIVELVKKKFKRVKEEEELLAKFVGSENAAVTEIIRKIKLQNRLLEELKRLLQEKEKPAERAATLSAADQEIFSRLEEIGRHIYREIDSGIDIRNTYSLHKWLSDKGYAEITFLPWTGGVKKTEWHLLALFQRNDPRCVFLPQPGIKLDKDIGINIDFYFEGYSENMMLKSTDVLKFARTICINQEDMFKLEKEVMFKVIEKGIIKREGAEPIQKRISDRIQEEIRILASLADRLKKIKLPKVARFASAISKALDNLIRRINKMSPGELMRYSERINAAMLRLIRWITKNVKVKPILELAERLRKLETERAPAMRINLLESRGKRPSGPRELGTPADTESQRGPTIFDAGEESRISPAHEKRETDEAKKARQELDEGLDKFLGGK